jgi:hypothetical protein
MSKKKALPDKPETIEIPEFQPHKTTHVIIKSADVDEEILPVVSWLNGFNHVQTQYCCQGEDDDNNKFSVPQEPYVVFHCFDQLTLAMICARIGPFGHVVVEWWEGSLRYVLKFNDKANLFEFVEAISV